MSSMSEVTGQSAWSGPDSGSGGPRRESLLARAFVRLADTLVEEFDVVEFLQSLSADSVEILGAEAAGVMLAGPRGELRLLASSEERMRILELFEIQGAQGPCLDAFSSGTTVQASMAEGRSRWPLFAPQASSAGFRIMLCRTAAGAQDRLSAHSTCSAAPTSRSVTPIWRSRRPWPTSRQSR